MESLTFDTGVKEYEVNGSGTLRFNPTDPNVYARLLKAKDDICLVEAEYVKNLETARKNQDKRKFSESAAQALSEADAKVKDILSNVFGQDNDFHKIFDGVSIVALQRDGKTRVLSAFLDAVVPIMKNGMKELFAHDDAMVQKYTAEYE